MTLTNSTQKIPRTVPKNPKSVMVQHKTGVQLINDKNRTKYDLQKQLK